MFPIIYVQIQYASSNVSKYIKFRPYNAAFWEYGSESLKKNVQVLIFYFSLFYLSAE